MKQPRRQPPPPAPPNERDLHEAALRHLARYACSVAGLVRVLDRRVQRWARATLPEAAELAAARVLVRAVAARLTTSGAVDDTTFAEGRSRTLARAGRSRRAIAAHLAVRGIDAELARASLPDDPDHDLTAALVLARKRRLGPFRPEPAADAAPDAIPGAGPDAALRRRELGALARAGFTEGLARRALGMARSEAETLLLRRSEQA